MPPPHNHQPSLSELFLTFLRLGLTAFGGPSMIAYIRRTVVEQKRWLEPGSFQDGVALCQVIPGATAIQCTAYVGLKTRGVRGAAVCYVAFLLPAFILMMAFAAIYSVSRSLPVVGMAFMGLQTVIVAIVANATISFGRNTLKTLRHGLIAAFAAAMFGLNVNPVLAIFLAAVTGIVLLRSDKRPPQESTFPLHLGYLKPLLGIIGATLAVLLLLFFVDRELFDLSVLLMRIDLTAFGGGFASIPLMLREIIDVRHWLDMGTFMDGIVLGQVTPGPIVITATFIGSLLRGPLGGLVATISIFLPSFLMVLLVSPFFDRLRSSRYFNCAIGGILCSFVGLLFTVIFRFGGNVHWDFYAVLLGIAALVALLMKVDVLWVVLAGIGVSVLIFML